MLVLVTRFSSSIADIIFTFPIKKILIPGKNQELQKNFLLSYKSW